MTDSIGAYQWRRIPRAGSGDKDVTLAVGYLPGRKSPALYTIEGSILTVLAYFRSPDAARKAWDVLDNFIETMEISPNYPEIRDDRT